MSKGLFITGTGTDVGKTYVTGLIVKKLSRVDHAVMENVEYDADGKEISRSYEPA